MPPPTPPAVVELPLTVIPMSWVNDPAAPVAMNPAMPPPLRAELFDIESWWKAAETAPSTSMPPPFVLALFPLTVSLYRSTAVPDGPENESPPPEPPLAELPLTVSFQKTRLVAPRSLSPPPSWPEGADPPWRVTSLMAMVCPAATGMSTRRSPSPTPALRIVVLAPAPKMLTFQRRSRSPEADWSSPDPPMVRV